MGFAFVLCALGSDQDCTKVAARDVPQHATHQQMFHSCLSPCRTCMATYLSPSSSVSEHSASHHRMRDIKFTHLHVVPCFPSGTGAVRWAWVVSVGMGAPSRSQKAGAWLRKLSLFLICGHGGGHFMAEMKVSTTQCRAHVLHGYAP